MNYWENANHSWTKDSTRYINTPSTRSRDLFYFVQEIGHFKANKPYFTERENLPSYLIKYTLSGTGELTYDGQTYTIEAGDAFFIDCTHYQHYKTISEEPWEMDWVHLYGGNVAAFYQEFIKNGNPVFRTHLKEPAGNALHLIITNLLQLEKEPNAKTDFQASVLLHELLNELVLQKYQIAFEDSEIPEYIGAVKKYLDENYRKGVTLEELAAYFHINKFQITKDFSKYIGQPPVDYQISQKISYAKDLLRYSKLSVKEISLEIGLENYAYFSRLFKKKAGITPSEYRKVDSGNFA